MEELIKKPVKRKKASKKKPPKIIELEAPTTLNPFEDFMIYEIQKDKPIVDLFEHKYKPDNLKDFVGNGYSIKILNKWLNDVKNPTNKQMIAMIHGPFGIGKSLLAELILKDYNIIECHSGNMSEKSKFFEKIEKIISSKSIDESLFDAKPSALIIDGIDKNLGDGVYYKRFLDLLEKYKEKLQTPIICVSSYQNLKKKYNTPSKVCIVKLDYPETNEMIKFCEKVQKNENLNISKSSIELMISASRYDFRKLLHYFKLLSIGKQKKLYNKKDIRKIIEFSETDVFYSAYEIIEETFNDNITKDIEDTISHCHTDQPLIMDLLYSNVTNGIDLEGASKMLDGFSISDEFQKYTYKHHCWEM